MSNVSLSPLGVDLDEVCREEYLHAVEAARALSDPRDDWDGCVEELWKRMVPAFGSDAEILAPRSVIEGGPGCGA